MKTKSSITESADFLEVTEESGCGGGEVPATISRLGPFSQPCREPRPILPVAFGGHTWCCGELGSREEESKMK